MAHAPIDWNAIIQDGENIIDDTVNAQKDGEVKVWVSYGLIVGAVFLLYKLIFKKR